MRRLAREAAWLLLLAVVAGAGAVLILAVSGVCVIAAACRP